jgi:glucose/mannose transport system permease protein
MADAVLGGTVVEDKEAAIASRRRLISRIIIYGLLGLISIVYIVPLAVVVLNSFRTNAEIGAMGLISLPMSFRLDAWPQAWSDFCIGGQCDGVARYFWNSVAMVVPATIISTALGAVNGYVLSKWRFPGSEIVFGCMLLGVFMPGQIALLPWAFLLGKIGLANSVYGLVLVHCIQGLSFTTLFFRN